MKASDLIDPRIKYGGGDSRVVELLLEASAALAGLENKELQLAELEKRMKRLLAAQNIQQDQQEELASLKKMIDDSQKQLKTTRTDILGIMNEVLEQQLPTLEGD